MTDGRWTYQPDVVTAPGETLQDLLDERGITQKDLALRMGRPVKTINEIVNGRAAITPETALQLEKSLGTPASFWIQREANYREYLARQDEDRHSELWLPWLARLPLKELQMFGMIPNVRRNKANNKSLLEAALRFFGVASPADWEKVYAAPQVAYRRNRVDHSDPGSIAAWLRLGELQAQRIQCEEFNSHTFERSLGQIRTLTKETPDVFQVRMRELCARSGVALALVPSIPRAHVSGVARWLSPHKALIQMSAYGKTNDRFWFTFFHEAGHICLHGKREVFLDEFDGKNANSEQERQANEFACNWLVPASRTNEFRLLRSRQAIQAFADRVGIHPGIVVGRLQHDGHIPWNYMNDLKETFHA